MNVKLSYSLPLLFIVTVVLFSIRLPIDEWALTHWAFHYEDEFLKRALMGSILSVFSPVWKVNELTIVSIVLYLICSTYYLYVTNLLIKDWPLKHRFLILMLMSVLPFSIPHFGFDLSRFDQLGFMILLSVVHLKVKEIEFPLYVLLVPLGILIHEVFIFLYLPTIFAIQMLRKGTPHQLLIKYTVWFVLISLPCLLLILFFGNSDLRNQVEFNQTISASMTPSFSERASEIYFRDTSDNLKLTVEKMTEAKFYKNLLKVAIVLFPFILLLSFFWRLIFNSTDENTKLLLKVGLLAQASIVIMLFLGLDYSRWISAYFLSNTLFCFYCLWYLKLHDKAVLIIEKYKKLIYAILIISLISGPLGVISPLKQKFAIPSNIYEFTLKLVG